MRNSYILSFKVLLAVQSMQKVIELKFKTFQVEINNVHINKTI